MHFPAASRGSPLTLASQQGGGGGHVLIIPIKSFKFFLARSVFRNQTLIRLLNISVFKSYSVLVVLSLQLLSC